MADPRGLSGAVFQPTQLRDFTQDLLVSDQYKAKKEAAAQKQNADYLSQFDVGEIKNAAHRKMYIDKVLTPLKGKMLEVAELKQTNPAKAREAEMELQTMARDAKVAVPALNALDASAEEAYKAYEKAKDYAGEEGMASVSAYGEFVDTPETWDLGFQNGELKMGDKYFLEGLRTQRFSFNEPYDLRDDIVDYYSVKKRDGKIDRTDLLKELNRAKGSQRQQKQFYNYLKEQKGYDEDRIQSAIQADSEGLVEEFYNYAVGELMSEKDEFTKSEESGGGDKTDRLSKLGRVGEGTYGKALFLPKDKIKFDFKEFVDDGKSSAELVTDATVISLQPNKNGDNILAEISYLKEDGFKEFDFVPLTADQESIVAAGLGLPDNMSIREFYQDRVGVSPVKKEEPKQEPKKGLMSGF